MLRRTDKSGRHGKRAFTLVELIVALVILAVLAAMLVPALTGYIRKARRAKYIEMADAARVAALAVMQERFAYDAVSSEDSNPGKDYRWDSPGVPTASDDDREWGRKVLELMGRGREEAGNEPYLLIFGVGNPDYFGEDSFERYNVYYVAYVEDENSPAVFYVNGEWMYTYPKTNGNSPNGDPTAIAQRGSFRNTIVLNRAYIPLQLIVVSNLTGQATEFWIGTGLDRLQGHCEGLNGF